MLSKEQIRQGVSELAKTYEIFKQRDAQNWVTNWASIDGGVGSFLVGRFCDADTVKGMFEILAGGLKANDPNAVKACEMVDELIEKDPSVQASINQAFGKSMLGLLQRKPLKDGLIKTLEDYHKANQIFEQVMRNAKSSSDNTSTPSSSSVSTPPSQKFF